MVTLCLVGCPQQDLLGAPYSRYRTKSTVHITLRAWIQQVGHQCGEVVVGEPGLELFYGADPLGVFQGGPADPVVYPQPEPEPEVLVPARICRITSGRVSLQQNLSAGACV